MRETATSAPALPFDEIELPLAEIDHGAVRAEDVHAEETDRAGTGSRELAQTKVRRAHRHAADLERTQRGHRCVLHQFGDLLVITVDAGDVLEFVQGQRPRVTGAG